MLLNRRDFLGLSFGLGAAAFSQYKFSGVSEALADEARKKLNVKKFTIKVGAAKPFSALHISDTHITLADDRENERKRTLAQNRSKYFGDAVTLFNSALEYAQENDSLLLHTGDFIDFVSEENLDFVANVYQSPKIDCFNSSGNHEYSQYVGEAREDDAYKSQSFERVQKSYPNDLMFCSKVFNGVNFVAFDDVYYYVAEDLIERFKAEIEKNLPIVAMCHVPFYTPDLFKFMMEDQKSACAYLTGVPDELMNSYKSDRFQQQRVNETTAKFIEWFQKQTAVKAILCGHLHVNFDGPYSETARQYVVGGNYKGDAFEYSFE